MRTTDYVISEVVFVLSGKDVYHLDREVIRHLVLPLIGLPCIRLPHKRRYRRVLEFYTSTPMGYVDAFHTAAMEAQGVSEVLSYDRHFDRVAGIRRREP